MVVAMAFALVAVVLIPSLAHAQVLYGTIVGRVTDPQQAALPGVTITATNTGTLLKLETVTDATGDYTFRNVPPGIYDLTVSLTGFKELRQTGLSVSAGNPKRINITLELGGVQETITVTAETTLIKTEKADLSTELTGRVVTTLPLNQYRNYQSLLNLVPGATPTMFQNAEIDTPGRSLRTFVNGIQPNANTTRVDGAVSVNLWLPHHAGYIQPAETVDTVNISTNNFDADTGMAAGAAQTVVTKSGTNEFRGSAFWFVNNDALNNNSYYNNYYYLAKSPLSRNTYGGTLGGPIRKNKLFFFGSYEKFRDRRGGNYTYVVPTDKMRRGDFSEVAAAYSSFKLYNPYSGTGTGSVGREQFADFKIPDNLQDPIARAILDYYPRVNSPSDLNSNSLYDDYVTPREVQVDRSNYDLKLTWQRASSHAVWGKFSMLTADVVDNFNLGWDNGSFGDTKVYVGAVGHTWTLGPTLVLDGNFGYYRQDQTVTGPDFGQDIGIELGIPGVNDPNDIRASGLPTFANGYTIGGTPSWMPLYRKEINYSFSSALTKVLSKHEVRAGVDIIKFELNHRQAEFGDYGLKGGFSFSGNTTGATGYTALAWNQFAGFLMGLPNYYSKDTQTEDMTAREWQTALYVRDRWRVHEKLTLNLGLRLEGYPLMSRATHGIERLDYNTYLVSIGGLGGVPQDVGIKMKTWYWVPRVGASYRIDDKNVVRAGYGLTYNPLAWSRPMRGSFPYDINNNATAEQYRWVTTLSQGIPTIVVPDYNSGPVKLPAGVFMRSPNPGQNCGTFPTTGDPLPCEGLDRAKIQQWNIAFEHKLPMNVAVEVAYVGTRTDGGYADWNLNYGEPGKGNPARKFYAQAGTTAISDWAARTKTRYNGLQVAIDRPFRQGFMLKGAYTYSVARNMTDEDGWVGLTWTHPLVYDKNYSYASFDRRHVFQMGFAYELPFLKESTTTTADILGGWQVNGVFAYYTGTPFSIGGTNNPLNCQACGAVYINVTGDPEPTGKISLNDVWYDKSLFSQPTGLDAGGFGNSERNQFRRPPVWNLDVSLFKAFQIGRVRPELRIEMSNILNNVNWGSPVTGFTANNFMQFTPGSTTQTSTVSGDIPGPRTVRIGLRVAF
jgi:hypothetical protein